MPDAIEDYKVTMENKNELTLESGYNPEQIKGFINFLSEVRGVEINGVPTNDKVIGLWCRCIKFSKSL